MKKGFAKSIIGPIGAGSFAGLGAASNTTIKNKTTILSLELGEKCPLSCNHCIYKGDREAPPNHDVLNNVVRSLKNGLSPSWISISGKEPTMFPKELIKLAKDLKSPDNHLILMTNGLLLNQYLIDRLIESIDCFDISLDGDQYAHEWMRGPNTYHKTINTVERLLENNASKIGIISTAVNASLPNGRPQREHIINLAHDLHHKFGNTVK